jgi:2-oxo-4-hydroxy-4-carboxy-5-ureidoimidazoline decarboxylase
VATGKRLTRLNQLPEAAAVDELRACCAAGSWLSGMVQARPFTSLEDLLETSDELVAAFDDAALAEALGAHPRIGERRDGVSREATLSRSEQAQALSADAAVQQRLRAGNRAYEQRFGHVFLIRAAGRSAQQMYDALQRRLDNDAATERGAVLEELAAIVRLRLEGLVAT